MSCGTGECGCGCGEMLHIHVKPESQAKSAAIPSQPFATGAALARSPEEARDR